MQTDLTEHVPSVFRFALSLSNHWQTAEDLAQECFLRAARNQQQLREPERVKAWLFRIVANLWKDHLKKSKAELFGEHDTVLTRSHAADWILMQKESQQEIFRMIEGLPEKQRAVIYLSCVEQMAHADIAELLQISASSVKTNLSIARKRLREQIMDNPSSCTKAIQ